MKETESKFGGNFQHRLDAGFFLLGIFLGAAFMAALLMGLLAAFLGFELTSWSIRNIFFLFSMFSIGLIICLLLMSRLTTWANWILRKNPGGEDALIGLLYLLALLLGSVIRSGLNVFSTSAKKRLANGEPAVDISWRESMEGGLVNVIAPVGVLGIVILGDTFGVPLWLVICGTVGLWFSGFFILIRAQLGRRKRHDDVFKAYWRTTALGFGVVGIVLLVMALNSW
jgi:MFS family permease